MPSSMARSGGCDDLDWHVPSSNGAARQSNLASTLLQQKLANANLGRRPRPSWLAEIENPSNCLGRRGMVILLTASHVELKIITKFTCFLACFLDSMTVSCSTNLLLLAHARSGPDDQQIVIIIIAQPAHRYLTMLCALWTESRTETTKGQLSKKHMPFQHRITARLGVVMVAGMVRPGPQVHWDGRW